MERIDALVIGAGVVGLAIARALARAGREVIVLEAESAMGLHASSRNSEVVHAGLYYPPGSLKARLCVAGRERLYRYCERRGVAYRRIGKLVVATGERQHDALARIESNAQACGVHEVRIWDRDQVRAMEPAISCTRALWSPATGIIDSHGLMRALLAEAETHGAVLALGNAFTRGRATGDGIEIETADTRVTCDLVVNAAGLHAQAVASAIEGIASSSIPPRYLCKGTYFTLTEHAPFAHLVYPVPDTASLGIHLTLDFAGAARFGPDQQWVDTIDYTVDPTRVDAVYPAVRTYWPALPDGALAPGHAGIRSKVQAPGQPMADFVVHGPTEHGVANLVSLYGIESPGLTACLALADHVLERIGVAPATDD